MQTKIFCGDSDLTIAAANHAAALLLCENKTACEECFSCKKVASKNHIDLIYGKTLDKSEKYTVSKVREIADSRFIKPTEGEVKVYIFPNAEELSPLCQNALLKTIEEPPFYCYFFFTVKNISALLSTVISRSEIITLQSGENSFSGNEHFPLASKIFSSIISHNEYETALSLALLNKDNLASVLELLCIICSVHIKKDPSFYNLFILETFEKYYKRANFFINSKITSAAIAAEIFSN